MNKRDAAAVATGVAAGAGAAIGYQAWKRSTERDMVDGRPAELRRLDPASIKADPETFQFKAGGDNKGVTDRLKSVESWNPVAAGKAMVFEKIDGTQVIADGHQRLGLAQRLIGKGQDGIKIDAYVMRERDGWTPRDVRAYAAIKNMHESSGQPLDMAKVMRERPDLLGKTKSLPMSDSKVADAMSLSKLSDAAFKLVVGGVVKPEYAAAVGSAVSDSTRHEGMLKEMVKAEIASAQHARLYVGQAMAAPTITESNLSLFGEETNTRSLLAERAKVLDKALSALKSDKRIFGLLEREAGNIESVGNKLSHSANVEKAEGAGRTASLIEKLATTRGPVSDMIDYAARQVAAGEKPTKAAREFVKHVGDSLKKGGINALTGDSALVGERGWQPEAREASAKSRAGRAKAEPRVQEMFGGRKWQSIISKEDIAAAREKIKGTSPEAMEKWGKILDDLPAGHKQVAKRRDGMEKAAGKANPIRVQRMEDPKGSADLMAKLKAAKLTMTTTHGSESKLKFKDTNLRFVGIDEKGRAEFRPAGKNPIGYKFNESQIANILKGGNVVMTDGGRTWINSAIKSATPPSSTTGQASMFGEATTSDRLAAQSRALEAKGRTGDPMNEGLFGSSSKQTDLVEMAKQAPSAPVGLTADSRYKFVGESRTLERGPVNVYMDKVSGVHVVADRNGAFDISGSPLGARQAPSGIEMAAAAANPEARFHSSASKITDHVEFKPAEGLKGPAGWSDAAREASAEARKAEPRGMDGKTRSERAGKAKAIPVIQDHNVPANASTMERFRAAYEATLTEQIKANPGKYSYGVDRVPEMARKMTEALAAGNGDHKGPVAAAVAKSLGIKPTIGGIKAALNDQPPPAPKPVEPGLTARQMGDAQRAIKSGGPMLKTIDLSQATNAQLQKLDDAALAARRSQTGTGNADWSKISQIENWRDSIRAEARKQTSSVVNDRPTNPNYTPGVGTKQESYWGAKAGPTPTVNELPEGAFKGTQRDFESLSPGMRREIARSAAKAAEAQPGIKDSAGNVWAKQAGSDAWSVEKPSPSVGTLKMVGIPADGSKPFTMAILDMGGSLADQQGRAHSNFEKTAHLYTQKLAGYQLQDSAGHVVGGRTPEVVSRNLDRLEKLGYEPFRAAAKALNIDATGGNSEIRARMEKAAAVEGIGKLQSTADKFEANARVAAEAELKALVAKTGAPADVQAKAVAAGMAEHDRVDKESANLNPQRNKGPNTMAKFDTWNGFVDLDAIRTALKRASGVNADVAKIVSQMAADAPVTVEKAEKFKGTPIPISPEARAAEVARASNMLHEAETARKAREASTKNPVSEAERAGRINRLKNRAGAGGLSGKEAEAFVQENLAKLEALDAKRAAPVAPVESSADRNARLAANMPRAITQEDLRKPLLKDKDVKALLKAGDVTKADVKGSRTIDVLRQLAEKTRASRAADRGMTVEAFSGTGLRGTQNAANQAAIIKNRKANAKPAPFKNPPKYSSPEALDERNRKAKVARTKAAIAALKPTNAELVRNLEATAMGAKRQVFTAPDPMKLGQARLDTAKAQAAIAISTGSKKFAAAGLHNAAEADKQWNAAEGAQAKDAMARQLAMGKRAAATEAYKAKFGYEPPASLSSSALNRWTSSAFKVGPGKPGDPAYESVVSQTKIKALSSAAKNAAAETAAAPTKSKGRKALGLLAPVAIGAAAMVAANQSAKAGESKVQQLQAAGTEAGKGAAVMAGFVAGTAAATKGLMMAGVTAARAVPAVQGLMMAGGAIHGAVTAEPGSRMKGAAISAWDMSLPGMVVNTGKAVAEAAKSTADRAPVNGRLSDQQAKVYAGAAHRYSAMRSAAASTDGPDKARGWSNAARISSYQARATKQGFDPVNTPYGGKPENGPSQWAATDSDAAKKR